MGKENDKAVYCHAAYLTYMQSTAREMQDWMTPKLESRSIFLRYTDDTTQLRYTDDTTLMAESKEQLKNLLIRFKRGE